jgi:hypothetical protein
MERHLFRTDNNIAPFIQPELTQYAAVPDEQSARDGGSVLGGKLIRSTSSLDRFERLKSF